MKWLLLFVVLMVGCETDLVPNLYSDNYCPDTYCDTRLYGEWTSGNDKVSFSYITIYKDDHKYFWHNHDSNKIGYAELEEDNKRESVNGHSIITYDVTDTTLTIIDGSYLFTNPKIFKRVLTIDSLLLGRWVTDSSSKDLMKEYEFLGYTNDYPVNNSLSINLITENTTDSLKYSYSLVGDTIKVKSFDYYNAYFYNNKNINYEVVDDTLYLTYYNQDIKKYIRQD